VFYRITAPVFAEVSLFFFYAVFVGASAWTHIFFLHDISLADAVENIAVLMTQAYLVVLMVFLSGSRFVRSLMYMAVVTIFFLYVFLRFNFQTNIAPNVVMLLFETTGQETSDFFKAFLDAKGSMYAYILTLAAVAAAFVAECMKHSLISFIKKRKVVRNIMTAVNILCLTLGIYYTQDLYGMFKCTDTDQLSAWEMGRFTPNDFFTNTSYSLYNLYLASAEKGKSVELTKAIQNEIVQCNENDSLNLIFVIGESHIKWHTGLYGYSLNTSPLMEQEYRNGNLIAFDNVRTPATLTSYAMKNIMNCNNSDNGEMWSDYPYFPAIFKKAGYYVSFYDNQKSVSADHGFTFALNTYLYDKDIVSMSYSDMNDSSFVYDADLVEYYGRSKGKQGKHNLLMFHFMGQHFDASSRYPHIPQFARFTADSIRRTDSYLTHRKKEEIAEYDNATLFTDYALGLLVDMYRNENSVLVYLSDHGEHIYDYCDSKGRGFNGSSSNYDKYLKEVPFYVWLSDKYKESHPEIVARLKEAKGRKYNTSNVCNLLFLLGGVETKYYRRQLDLIGE